MMYTYQGIHVTLMDDSDEKVVREVGEKKENTNLIVYALYPLQFKD